MTDAACRQPAGQWICVERGGSRRKGSKSAVGCDGESGDVYVRVEAEIPRHLLCAVCLNVVGFDAVQTPCFHVFCLKCIAVAIGNAPQCPVDRRSLKLHELRELRDGNPLVYRIWQETKVSCRNQRLGHCEWVGFLRDEPIHAQSCDPCIQTGPVIEHYEMSPRQEAIRAHNDLSRLRMQKDVLSAQIQEAHVRLGNAVLSRLVLTRTQNREKTPHAPRQEGKKSSRCASKTGGAELLQNAASALERALEGKAEALAELSHSNEKLRTKERECTSLREASSHTCLRHRTPCLLLRRLSALFGFSDYHPKQESLTF
mmetsp:Transcript_13505/g.29270  ORF Transcript_13505/g.29270 Transcript_13505/m.29270 type:complete len:315 (-) Transcript_13505:1074-2018(-)